ncbi:MAG: sulfatase-like hydrolase/transferase [Planctomycetota bacterium]
MSAPERPNLLFLMTDHQRADSIGMVQDGVEVTPNLNRLAERGAYFARCYNTCPLCVPARTALFTGRYPTANGVVYNDWHGTTARERVPLQQVLVEAGYRVGHVGVHHVRVDPDLRERVPYAAWVDQADHGDHLSEHGIPGGLPGGPDRFKRTVDERVEGERKQRPYSNTETAVWPHPAEHFKDLYWSRRAAEFLGAPADEPFALFVFLWAPHPPLVLPEPYATMFDPEALELPSNVGKPAEGEPPGRRRGAAAQIAEGVPMRQWRRVWAAHLGLTRLADDGIGTVLEALEESGHADRTVLAFTVDHGEHLGQHRMYQKMEMYEQAVRVPLIILEPGTEPSEHATPIWHLDVLPTLNEMLGLRAPARADGTSLADCVRGEAEPRRRTLFGQYSGNPALGDIRRMALRGDWKYVYDPAGEPELFDLSADPLEMHNLARSAERGGRLIDLHAHCAAFHERHGDWVDY